MTLLREGRFDERVLLPRKGADLFWQSIEEHYARSNSRRWKRLAMLALRENAGWPVECIGKAFGHSKGTVTRSIEIIKRDIRCRFDIEPDIESPDWPAGLNPEQKVNR